MRVILMRTNQTAEGQILYDRQENRDDYRGIRRRGAPDCGNISRPQARSLREHCAESRLDLSLERQG